MLIEILKMYQRYTWDLKIPIPDLTIHSDFIIILKLNNLRESLIIYVNYSICL